MGRGCFLMPGRSFHTTLQRSWYNANTGDTLRVTLRLTAEPESAYHEKSAADATCYESNHVKYYIICNNGQLSAVWSIKNMECSITGTISENDLKAMIDSIYEEN